MLSRFSTHNAARVVDVTARGIIWTRLAVLPRVRSPFPGHVAFRMVFAVLSRRESEHNGRHFILFSRNEDREISLNTRSNHFGCVF